MTSSLVGSEMCIRDRSCFKPQEWPIEQQYADQLRGAVGRCHSARDGDKTCLLYTSDAADDM
eukprot:9425957-Prorocentrum_lima.AAC.1